MTIEIYGQQMTRDEVIAEINRQTKICLNAKSDRAMCSADAKATYLQQRLAEFGS